MLPLAIEVAQGLKAAKAAGLIHRDVKPGNILLDAEGHAKLVDFGLALVTQGGKAQAKELWATPYYVPPETVEGDEEDFRSDIYAFGATLYHALAGKPSCGEESMSTDLLREASAAFPESADVAGLLTEIARRPASGSPGSPSPSIAVLPLETSMIWRFRLRWSQPPVLQRYSAYTPGLDRIDASFLASKRAPT